jgi:hypothetical protein
MKLYNKQDKEIGVWKRDITFHQLKRFEAFEIGWEQRDKAASLTSSPGENIQLKHCYALIW